MYFVLKFSYEFSSVFTQKVVVRGLRNNQFEEEEDSVKVRSREKKS